ncbi:pyruvate dehydrogenase [Micractinium conductrix]|uniref:Pyruvate dehydrogenase n=1 Tax=Micractinium conductrix TaxID=554055 RepID=A0A2P6VCI7_9CHLO|nr:pyruvate dehydrogenase [Micractinium conductrix]|eukprot:PSC71810.1 pyruvate dehydrogenase [Micractinium conductrix]
MARPRSALLALALMLTAFGAARAQAGCPLTAADVQAINFSKAAQACRAGTPVAQLCESCVCALVEAFTPAVAAAGFTQDQVTGVNQDQATQILTTCAGTVLGPLRSAGISIQALFQLQSCQGSGVTPTCLAGLAQAQQPAQNGTAQQAAQPQAQTPPQPQAQTPPQPQAQPEAQPRAQPVARPLAGGDLAQALGSFSQARTQSQQAQVAAALARARRAAAP